MKLLNIFNWLFNRNNNNTQSIVNSIVASNSYIAEKLAYLNRMYFELKLTYPVEFFYNELINEKNSLILERKKLELEYSNILPKLERYVNLVEEQEILKDELINLAKKNAGYSIAKKMLEEAYVEIKNSVTPKFFDNLSDVVKTITNGKYVKVYVNDEIEVEDYLGKIYSIDKLSFGTIEEIYFSLRVSIALMISDEKFPIILDESFVYFDDNRLRSILNYLYSLDNQIIILSSNKREKNLLDFENYDYNFIQL